MVKLTGLFSRLQSKKVLVIGDLLLDSYTIGKAQRISPEAPVAVVAVEKEEARPGGAGNVALNLAAMGQRAALVGRIGKDSHGEQLLNALRKEGIDTTGLFVQNGYPTPVKNRIIAENQQIVRVDREELSSLPELLEQNIIEALPHLIQGVGVIALSDYSKGFLTPTLIASIIEFGKQASIPVIVDPKGLDFSRYRGATIIKPNQSEAYLAANLPKSEPLEKVAEGLLRDAEAESLLITRSEAGISIFEKKGARFDFPVHVREVKDVTGAGDTVLAALAFAVGSGLPLKDAALLANVAAGIAIERFGCARISLSDLSRRLLEMDTANKVFDEEHLSTLEQALKGRAFALLGISGEEGLSTPVFQAIRNLSSPDRDLIIYIREESPSEEFVNLLSSIHEVGFIIIKTESLRSLCSKISPELIHVVENGELKKLDLIKDLLLNP